MFLIKYIFLLFAISLLSCKTEQKKEKPNIVLIMADDMGFSDIGCFGGEIETPNIDQLAREGVSFTQFYNTSRCCPTRASLMTGLYPHEAGLGGMTGRNYEQPGYLGYLNDQCVTIAEVLGNSGYQTNMVGKWHAGAVRQSWPENRGFQRFYGSHHYIDSYFTVLEDCEMYENGKMVIPKEDNPVREKYPHVEWYTTDVFTDKALDYMDQSLEKEDPFLMYVAYNAPHWPLHAHDHDIAKYLDKYNGGWDSLRQVKYERMIDMGIIDKKWNLSEPEYLTPWSEFRDTVQINALQVKGGKKKMVSLSEPADSIKVNMTFRRALYAAQIDNMDQNIGRIIQYLKAKGIYDNTIIMFLSDNGSSAQPLAGSDWKNDDVKLFGGWNFNRHTKSNYQEWRKIARRDATSQGIDWALASNAPFRKYKKFIHEGGISTPLIISWPKAVKKPDRMEHVPGHIMDIMPTLLDITGVEYPDEYNGEKIKPLSGISLMPVIYGNSVEDRESLYWEHEGRAAIRKGQWKLVSLNAKDSTYWELYDIEKDRTETNNLAAEFPNVVAELHEEWTKWANETNVLPWPEGGKPNPVDK